MCGRYIMIRDVDIHRETNCEYPAVQQKTEAEDAAARFDGFTESNLDSGHFHELLRGHMLHSDLSQHMLQMLEKRGSEPPLEDLFGEMGFGVTNSGIFRPSAEDPPPPYSAVEGMYVRDGHVRQEEQNTVAHDDDDGKQRRCHCHLEMIF